MGHFLQLTGEFIYNFFFIGVIGYIIKKWIAIWLMKVGKNWVNQTERNVAIWTHYSHKARGEGHTTESVLDCDDQRCRIFTTYVS